ncbi:MAG: hypothetical protein KDD52_08740 [Bdellovibrionales bacterium]|nr:hypothetical protein [Bdellovibrionales bacterium]
MYAGGHSPLQNMIMTLILELVFLGICGVFIGQGIAELKKKKQPLKNLLLVFMGITMVGVSFIATSILLEG